jgi:hypothetical protein
MDKMLIITPHLSTGGLPQYLFKKIGLLVLGNQQFYISLFSLETGYLVEILQDVTGF